MTNDPNPIHDFLNDETLKELTQIAQAGLEAQRALTGKKRGRKTLEKTVWDGQKAVERILGSVEALLVKETDEALERQINQGGTGNVESREDLYSAARTAAIEAVLKHDLILHKSPVFLSIQWAVKDALSVGKTGRIPRSWLKLGRVAWATRTQMQDVNGERVNMASLQKAVEEKCHTWAQRLVLESTPMLKGQKLEQAIEEKLSRSGTTAALAILGTVMNATAGERYLDEPAGEDMASLGENLEERTLGVEEQVVNTQALQNSVSLALGGLCGQAREAVACYLDEQTEDSSVTYQEIADAFSIDTLWLKRAVRDVRNRVCSPHGQYCYLIGPGPFDEPIEKTVQSRIFEKAEKLTTAT